MTRFTLDSIAIAGFGYRFNSFAKDQLDPFLESLATALIECMNKTTRLPIQQRFAKKGKDRLAAAISTMNDLVDQVIAQRRAHPTDGGDLLNLMLETKDPQSGEKLDDLNIRYQILTFLIAGHETTSGMLSFAFYQLLRYPHILAQAYAEVDRVLPGDKRPDYTAARARLGWNADETVLLFLSRIHAKKGLDLLLSALSGLHGTLPPATRLVVVGPEEQPEYAAHCRDYIAQNSGRLPRTDWIGAVWGVERWSYFQGADLFCLPTHSENFGLAVLEACQVGTPALTTTETPWADVLTAGQGFIAQPEASSIRTELGKFFAEPRWAQERRQALSAWACSEYDWASLGPRYASLYESIL